MKSKYAPIVILITMIFCTFFSCKKHFYYPNELNWANSLMNTAPDSALSVLKSIPNPSSLRGKARADYALLFSQACDKNQIFHTDDSLIQIAVDYYKDKDLLNAAKSFFYLGSVYRNGGQDVLAVQAFLKALEKMPKGANKLRMQIYFNLGERYYMQSLYEDALNMFSKSLDETLLLNDSSLLYFPYYWLANTFRIQDNNDSALFYYEKALENSKTFHDERRTINILVDISITSFYNDSVNQALKMYEYIHSLYGDVYNVFWNGKFLFLKNEWDSAKYFLQQGAQSDQFYTKASCFNLLSEIEKERLNHAQAYAYIDSFNAYRDSINSLKQHEKIQRLNVNHALELKTQENERREERIYWTVSWLVMCIILGCIISFLYIRKKHKEELLKQERLLFYEQSHNIHSYLEEKFGEDIPLKETATVFKQEKLQAGIDAFRQTKWKGILEEANKTIKPGDFIKLGQEELYKDLAVCFQEFTNLLVKAYPKLSEDDIRFIIFSAMDFKTRLIAYCMNTSNGALRIRKNRLKKNMAEETFLMIFKS